MIKLLLGVVLLAHLQDAELPTDRETWNSCCHELDCREMPVSLDFSREEVVDVSVADFPPYFLPTSKVKPSKNGKSYVCWHGANFGVPPDSDNTFCVFYVMPNYVKGEKNDK